MLSLHYILKRTKTHRSFVTTSLHDIDRIVSRRYFSYSLKVENVEKFFWKGADVGIKAAYTPPSTWYTDPDFFTEVERKVTFRNHWLYAAHKDSLRSTGDYVAGNIAGEPYVVVKSNESDIQAFYNVCRHHAAQICDDGPGSIATSSNQKQPRFICPYHGWQYTLDGKLAKALHMKGCENFAARDNGLLPIAADQLGPWIFLNFQSATSSVINASINTSTDVSSSKPSILEDQPDLRLLHEKLSATGYESLVHVARRRYNIKCNWKVFIDNYLDGGYHVPVAHPGLAKALNMQKYRREGYPHFYLQACGGSDDAMDNRVMGSTAPSSSSSYIDTSSSISTSSDTSNTFDATTATTSSEALYLFHYPNLCVNRYGDWMDTNVVWPVGPSECIVEFDWYAHPRIASNDEYIKKCLVDSDQVQQEDIWLCERVQKGLQSTAYGKGGRYAPELEGGEFMFHQLLQKDIETAAKSKNVF